MLTLFRLIDVTAGRIMLDGVDTSSIGVDALRSQLAIIPQVGLAGWGTGIIAEETCSNEKVYRHTYCEWVCGAISHVGLQIKFRSALHATSRVCALLRTASIARRMYPHRLFGLMPAMCSKHGCVVHINKKF